METTKSFSISKQIVWKAYEKVKANKGAAGVDGESIKDFEKNLKDNLYKIWNRMSSGSYFPKPVRMVEIPKKDKGTRFLGVSCVSDRIAQTVVKIYLEPKIEPYFKEGSYGYRPGKSALDAVGKARERCWRYDWILDLDIEKFFDSVDRELLMRAVRKHTDCKWILLYIERWLKAPSETAERLEWKECGVIQGNVISPMLANLFLHYALDKWLERAYPHLPYERYVDDAVIHCRTEEEARELWQAIDKRLIDCRLKLHSGKTKIVYCKDDNRKGNYPHKKFNFLGYTFRPRKAKNSRGEYFYSFMPAISNEAAKSIRKTMRQWKLHLQSNRGLEDIADRINPFLRGWKNFYGKYYKSALYPIFKHLNRRLVKWAMWKYKRLKRHKQRATEWLKSIQRREPHLLSHWEWVKP